MDVERIKQALKTVAAIINIVVIVLEVIAKAFDSTDKTMEI